MQIGILSMRYAKALFRFAMENNESSEVYVETQTLAQSFLRVPALHKVIYSPLLTHQKKVDILLSAACGKAKPSVSIQKFIDLIIHNKRLEILQFAANSYGTLYRKKNNLIESKLTVPTEIPEELIERIKSLLETKTSSKVNFNVEIEPEILGGFILHYDNYRLDASVRHQLDSIKRQLA